MGWARTSKSAAGATKHVSQLIFFYTYLKNWVVPPAAGLVAVKPDPVLSGENKL